MMTTMITHRRVDFERDRDTLLELHSHANYASSSPWVRSLVSFEEYRDDWLETAQPSEFLGNLAKAMEDPRTVAELWEVDGEPAGLVCVRFTDTGWRGFTRADVYDLAVAPAFRRMGIGSLMMEFAEEVARSHGANALYVGTDWENGPARALYEKRDFRQQEVQYEMLFRTPDPPEAAGSAPQRLMLSSIPYGCHRQHIPRHEGDQS